jgi:hypothetical protein
MKKQIITVLLLISMSCFSPAGFSQNIGINATGAAPDSSAMLDVQSTAKGMLVPRMTSAQRNAILLPATGLMVFDNTTKSFWFKSTSRWVELVDSTNTIWKQEDASVYLNDNQKVGIGTSAPDVRLNIERGTDAGYASGGYLQLGATNDHNLAFDNNEIMARFNGGVANLALQLNGGSIGIGTSTPQARLHINNGDDAGAVSGGYLQLGPSEAINLAFDNNEIQARNNGTVSTLYLQNNGGPVQVGAAAGSTTDVHINNGKLVKTATGNANMMPLCYGRVSANGTLISGTPNVTIVKGSRPGEYYINCTGITSSTIMTACPNDIHGATKLNAAYNAANQAFVMAVIADTDPENEPFSFVFYNL